MAALARCTRVIFANKPQLLKAVLIKNNPTLKRGLHASPFLRDRKYSEKHEWIEVSGGIGTVGISHYAQDQLGDVVYAQLPEAGTEFDQDEECGALESVKAASEIYTPVSGTVTESNTQVEEKPALINQSCYDKGWLFKLELSNPDEVLELMDEDRYKSFLKDQEQ